MTVLRRAYAVVLVTLAVDAVAAQQPPGQPGSSPAAPPTGLIVGQTLDGTTGKPISGAIVSINRPPVAPGAGGPAAPVDLNSGPTRVISDGSGHFVFHDLAAGSYTLTAAKPGYADAAYGRRTAVGGGSQSLTLADGERRGNLALTLWKFATLGGTVVDEAGEPIIGIQVRVLKRAIVGGRPSFTQFGNMPSTDDRGVYRLPGLVPGDYVVGIVTTQTSVPTSLQEALAVAGTNGTSADLQRELDRSRGSINRNLYAGTTGQRVGSWLLQTPFGGGNGDLTPPAIGGGRVFVYPSVFYPAATSPSKAALVTLGSGEERTSIDFQLRPVVASRVSGVLTGPEGPEVHTNLDLVSASAGDVQRDTDFAAASTTTDATGAFTFLGVTPGNYTIRALKIPARPNTPSTMTTVIQTGSGTISSGGGPSIPPPIPNEPTYWAAVPVAVGETDVTDLAITLSTGARVSGRIEFEGAAQKPAIDRLRLTSVQIDRADGRTTSFNQFTLSRGVIDATSQFNSYQLPAGRYVVRGPGFPNWTFKGAFLNGRDVSETPLELAGEDIRNVLVTYTDRPTEIAGTARDDKGPDATATVLVFPERSASWTDYSPGSRAFRSVRPGMDGAYRITGVPAGDYLVVAVRAEVRADWQEAAFLQQIAPLATRLTIADGEQKRQDLTTKEVR